MFELKARGRGRTTGGSALLEGVSTLLEAREVLPPLTPESVADGVVAVRMHPAAEPLIATVRNDSLEVAIRTGTAGPGYHRFGCELLDLIAEEADVTWSHVQDPTGDYTARDDRALMRWATAWMLDLVADIRARTEAASITGHASVQLSLNLPAETRFAHRGRVATSLGPRDDDWLRTLSEDPLRCADAFPWWHLERDAAFYLRCALSLMWTEVRWRPPMDEDERAIQDLVVTLLERAHGLDATLDYPLFEWAELFALMGEESLRAMRVRLRAERAPEPPARALIGYRRRPVRSTLSGGWSIEIPGEMGERWEDRGTFVAFDTGRSLFFNSMENPDPASSQATLAGLGELSGGEVLEFERGGILGRAVLMQEKRGPEPLYRLDAQAALGQHAALGTLLFERADDRAWALETWGSLAHEDEGR